MRSCSGSKTCCEFDVATWLIFRTSHRATEVQPSSASRRDLPGKAPGSSRFPPHANARAPYRPANATGKAPAISHASDESRTRVDTGPPYCEPALGERAAASNDTKPMARVGSSWHNLARAEPADRGQTPRHARCLGRVHANSMVRMATELAGQPGVRRAGCVWRSDQQQPRGRTGRSKRRSGFFAGRQRSGRRRDVPSRR